MPLNTTSSMSFFASNPFSSPVGQRIEKATNESLASEDWALSIEICDIINESEDAHKEAMKAFKKKLSGNKKWKEVMYTLTLLETCVKNCGHRFHVLICKQDFIKELVKIIQPSFNPPTAVQEKILMLIQSVPETDPAVSRPPPQNRQPIRGPGHPPARAPAHAPAQPEGPVNLTPDQLAKMQKDLEVVQGNYRVFSEMLTEMTPGQEDPGDLELLQELSRTCRSMQSRVVHLLNIVSNEEVTGELLRINDDLNNVFVRYDRFERYRQQSQSMNPQAHQTTGVQSYAAGTGTNPPAYQVGASTPAYLVGAPHSYPVASPVYPSNVPITGQLPYPAAGAPAYGTTMAPPTQPGGGYPVGTGQVPYPVGAPAYGTTTAPPSQPPPSQPPPTQPSNENSSVGTLISFDDEPAAPTHQPSPAVGQLSHQLAGMTMGGDSVSSTLGNLESTPTPTSAANADDFDMFALSRQTVYQDPTRGGSTYQDNSNMDQTKGGLANAMNSRAVNPFAAEAQAVNQEDVDELPPDFSQLENMEQWLQESDLSKAVDNTAAANTNTEGITSSGEAATSFPQEFDKFLEERAAAGDTLPTHGSTVNRGGRQLKMEETENTMFSL
ncbi:target of Myb protein 1-like [Anneissia japonica]|uniref:target of Myb protein 1-like n=1 Tax=Anneissia japonica TaxID=1529436 RepID=UPI001425AC26|nr:target of Myb protein 1-like [Anneissia japonica]